MKRVADALALPEPVRSALEELPPEMLNEILSALQAVDLQSVAVASSHFATHVTQYAVSRFHAHLYATEARLAAWNPRQPLPLNAAFRLVPPEFHNVFSRGWFVRHGMAERFQAFARGVCAYEALPKAEGAAKLLAALDHVSARADYYVAFLIMYESRRGNTLPPMLEAVSVALLLDIKLGIDVGQLATLRKVLGRGRTGFISTQPLIHLLGSIWAMWAYPTTTPAPTTTTNPLSDIATDFRQNLLPAYRVFERGDFIDTTERLLDALERVQ